MRTISLLALLATMLALSAGVAAAATSGVLTNAEYYQLATAQSRVKALKAPSTPIKRVKRFSGFVSRSSR